MSKTLCGHPDRRQVSAGRCWECHIAYLSKVDPMRAERLIENKRLHDESSFNYPALLEKMAEEMKREQVKNYPACTPKDPHN